MLAFALSTALAVPPAGDPPRFHAVAFVTDSLSHGLVGDGLLSLNEAIRLHNGTLLVNQLSAAEQAQVQLIPGTGVTPYLTWASFDGSSTPVVTIERDLDPIVDQPFGFYIDSINEPTTLDFTGPGLQHGMRAPANSLELKDLVFLGGPYGIDCQLGDGTGQAGLVLGNVHFDGQAQFGIRVTATTTNHPGRLYLEDCSFRNCGGTAVHGVETLAGRLTICELHDCRFAAVQRAIDLELGQGGTGRYTFDRLVIDAAVSGIRLQRPNGANRTAILETWHVDIRAPLGAVLECSPTGPTLAMLRMWHVRATTGGTAFALGALGDAVFGDLEDGTFDGHVQVLAGGTPSPLAIANLRCRQGTVTFGSTPTQPLPVTWSAFDQCTVQTTGSAAVSFADCCFTGGSLVGTTSAPAQATNSFVANPGSHVTSNGALPAAQLGSVQLLPDVVTIGSTATFQVDLPNGLWGVFLLGYAGTAVSFAQPLHVYSSPTETYLVPGVFRQQQSYGWSIPNWQILIGTQLVLGLAVLPDPNVTAPAVQLPPGRHFTLR